MTHHANFVHNIVNYGDLSIKNNVIKQGFQLNKSGQGNRLAANDPQGIKWEMIEIDCKN